MVVCKVDNVAQDGPVVFTVYDLCREIGALLIKAWGDEWKDSFTPEYPKGTAATRRITYRVVRRVRGANRGELVHRYLRSLDAQGRTADIYGRTYDITLQFDIWSKSAMEADDLVVRFDDFVAVYANYFRQNGVILIAFMEQLEDEHMDRWREDWYIRSLRFLVLIEDMRVDASMPLTHVGARVAEPDASVLDDMSIALHDQYYLR